MRIFATKAFARFARHEDISAGELCEAIERAEAGLIAADLGGGIIKQRIARKGQGKSGGLRTIVIFRQQTRAVFVYGYAKSARSDIGPDELKAFRRLAAELLSLDTSGITAAMKNGTLQEIKKS
ncbi:MAG: type II toxin-antitoxin system RelE/ParE family toxin [Alphaproteobacteria bacterium]|nr:type II toxin-antitoxin system RelE/ParE family toxin [Alphaproteobacteria bacterium]